jgi:hypothetical protein
VSLPDPPYATVAVATTSTVVWSGDVRVDEWLCLQLQNLDGAQTFTGTIERRLATAAGWATSTIPDFSSVPPAGTVDPTTGAPLDSITADLDIEATGYIRLVGQMSGAGGNVAVVARKGQRK